MAASIEAYVRRMGDLKRELPAAVQMRLDVLGETGDYDSGEYQDILMDVVYPRYMCRTKPWPEPVTRGFANANPVIYTFMLGMSEFVVTGAIRDWNRWDGLHEIGARTLTLGARYDTMDPADMVKMAEQMPNAISAICSEGSHLPMRDDQATYFEYLLRFFAELLAGHL